MTSHRHCLHRETGEETLHSIFVNISPLKSFKGEINIGSLQHLKPVF